MFFTKTGSEVNADKVMFYTNQIPFTKVQADNILKQPETDIITLLTNTPPSTVPSLQSSDDTKYALLKIELIFNITDGKYDFLPNQTKTTFAVSEQLFPKQTIKLFQLKAPQVIKQTTPIKSNPTSLSHREQT